MRPWSWIRATCRLLQLHVMLARVVVVDAHAWPKRCWISARTIAVSPPESTRGLNHRPARRVCGEIEDLNGHDRIGIIPPSSGRSRGPGTSGRKRHTATTVFIDDVAFGAGVRAARQRLYRAFGQARRAGQAATGRTPTGLSSQVARKNLSKRVRRSRSIIYPIGYIWQDLASALPHYPMCTSDSPRYSMHGNAGDPATHLAPRRPG